MQRNALVELFWRWHPRIYRVSRGRLLGRLAGLPVLLLETLGRRSGARRCNALTYLPWSTERGEAWVVVASLLGEPRHPAWYLNLRADPEVAIEVGRARIAVVARVAEGDERDRIWRALVARSPDYEAVAEKKDRVIPLVVLERRRQVEDGVSRDRPAG